ncbi:nuclear transport factor 2 family protein [Streptomyces sp. LP05-1]|uniref:Nuclear transport factor 2 family protein n=1 Tax=Streptomyces pyxinae TaxID=2970734 RepID=A0ABT2CM39_9ACTN|nr:nuclear transport factor 2 family protein [Streptomyces sp. LP05-1]MCS0638493.1 nuclear transport factor 2 family protein [Streptomyces sp. LP05-1]
MSDLSDLSDRDAGVRAAENFLKILQARDWQALEVLFAPDITWTVPGSGPLSGTVRGTAAAVARARLIARRGVRTELLHLLTGRHGVALILHNTATAPDGRVLDEHLAAVLTVRDGEITAIDSHLSDVDGKDRFFD